MTSYDIEQVLDRLNKDYVPYGGIAIIFLMVVLLFWTTDCKWRALSALYFGSLIIFVFAMTVLDISSNELDKRQDLLRLQDNNVAFCYEDTSINLDDIKQSSSNSNSKHCKYWIQYANFYWDSGSVHITTDDPEVDKMLNSCIEGSATKQSTASGSAVSDSPKQQSKRGGKKDD